MATGTLAIQVGQHGNVTLSPTKSSVVTAWPGGTPTWATNNANVSLAPLPGGLSCDVLGLLVGSSTITITGAYTNSGGTTTTLTSTVTVTVSSASPQPDALGLSTAVVPLPVAPRQP